MFDSAALMHTLYDTGPYGAANVCTLGATEFAGILEPVDVESWDGAAVVATHRLHYQHGMLLAAGDLVVIDGGTYKVYGVPQRDHDAMIANLAKQA